MVIIWGKMISADMMISMGEPKDNAELCKYSSWTNAALGIARMDG